MHCSRRCRLCLARGSARRRRRRRSGGLRVAASRSDRLGQATLRLEPRRLSLEARNLLVRRARRQGQSLDGRPHADDGLGDRQQQSFRHPQREQSWGHGTQKPVECMRRPIVKHSRPGQAIYDPFLGSGTSLIAAEMTGRVCCGLELKPRLCRCRRATLAGLHRAGRDASRLRAIVRGARPKAGPRPIRSRTWQENHLP